MIRKCGITEWIKEPQETEQTLVYGWNNRSEVERIDWRLAVADCCLVRLVKQKSRGSSRSSDQPGFRRNDQVESRGEGVLIHCGCTFFAGIAVDGWMDSRDGIISDYELFYSFLIVAYLEHRLREGRQNC